MRFLKKPPPKKQVAFEDALVDRAKKETTRLKRQKVKALERAARNRKARAWRLSRDQMKAGIKKLTKPQFRALELACRQMGRRCRKQLSSLKPFVYRPTPGWTITQKLNPLRSVALVLPPSPPAPQTPPLLSTAIAAALAGVQERIVCVSPDNDGRVSPLMLTAAFMTEVTQLLVLPETTAMAALAMGCGPLPQVDKLFAFTAPPNLAMKHHLHGLSSTDVILTGASELMVLAEGQARPDLIAMELASHRERHPQGPCGLVTTEKDLIREVKNALKSTDLPPHIDMDTHPVYLVCAADRQEAVALANRRCPEHLWLLSSAPELWEAELEAYGVLHIGPHAAEVLAEGGFGPALAGDAGLGWRGMVSVLDFLQCCLIEEVVPGAYKRLAKASSMLSKLEGRPQSAETALSRVELKPWQRPKD